MILRTSLALLFLIVAAALPCSTQSSPDLETFFQQDIGLSQDEIAAIRSGQPVAKAVPSRTPAEVFLFGAVYIHAAPESYLQFARDVDRLRKLPGYPALGVFSNPPQLSDLEGFSFDNDDIEALKSCKPSVCLIQMPEGYAQQLRRSIDWSAADVSEQVNQLLQKAALQLLLTYQREGNPALGVYVDKREPVNVSEQFAYMLSYAKALPAHLPDFDHYLLSYPSGKPANVEDTFYWAKVKFGMKPTLRVVHTLFRRGNPDDPVAYALAEKQLYSSHYFETALDLTFCVRGSDDTNQPGFYLIMALGSEQAGLSGPRGSIVRKVAVGRSVSNLKETLTSIKNTLEGEP